MTRRVGHRRWTFDATGQDSADRFGVGCFCESDKLMYGRFRPDFGNLPNRVRDDGGGLGFEQGQNLELSVRRQGQRPRTPVTIVSLSPSTDEKRPLESSGVRAGSPGVAARWEGPMAPRESASPRVCRFGWGFSGV